MAGETELRPLPRIHERRTTGPRAWRCACVTQVACAADGMVLRRKEAPWACAREPLRKPVGMPRSAGNKTRGLLVGAVPRVLFCRAQLAPTEIIMQRPPDLTSALAIGVSHLASDQQRAGAAPARRRARPGRRHAALAATGADCGTRLRRRLVAGMHADGGALLPGQLVDAQVHLLATRGVQTRIHVFAVDIGVVRHHAAARCGPRPAWGDSRGSSDTSP